MFVFLQQSWEELSKEYFIFIVESSHKYVLDLYID